MKQISYPERAIWQSPWISGQLALWSTLMVTSFLVALLLRFTPFDEGYLPLFAYLIHLLALFLSGFYAGRNATGRAWLYGGAQGLLYAVILYVISQFLLQLPLKAHPLPLILCCIGIAAMGGIFGNNEKPSLKATAKF